MALNCHAIAQGRDGAQQRLSQGSAKLPAKCLSIRADSTLSVTAPEELSPGLASFTQGGKSTRHRQQQSRPSLPGSNPLSYSYPHNAACHPSHWNTSLAKHLLSHHLCDLKHFLYYPMQGSWTAHSSQNNNCTHRHLRSRDESLFNCCKFKFPGIAYYLAAAQPPLYLYVSLCSHPLPTKSKSKAHGTEERLSSFHCNRD